MNIIFALILLTGLYQVDTDSTLADQSNDQAMFYMQQVNHQVEEEASLWALTELFQSNPQVQTYIQEQIRERNYTQSLYQPFQKKKSPEEPNMLQEVVFNSGSPALFIKLLLEINDVSEEKILLQKFEQRFGLGVVNGINYPNIAKSIINGTTIDQSELPNDKFHLLHLFLILDPKGYQMLSESYYKTILNNWENMVGNIHTRSFENQLMNFSYFRISYLLDRYEETKRFYTIITTDKLFPNSQLKYRFLRTLDYSMYRQGFYDLSLKAARDYAAPLARYLNDKKSELSAMMVEAAYLDKIGKINEAQKVNLEILKQSERYNISVNRSTLQNNLSLTYKKSGEFDKYLDLQLKALDKAKETDNYTNRLRILINLSLYYQEIKDKKSALLYLNEARKIAQEENNIENLGRIYMLLGMLHRDFDKNYERALSFFQKSKDLLNSEDYFNFYAQTLDEEAKLYEDIGRLDLSRKNLRQIVQLSQSRDEVIYLETNLRLVDLNLNYGEIDSATHRIKEVKSHDITQLSFENIVKFKTLDARLLNKKGKKEEAFQLLKPTINQIVERAKNSTDLQTGFWSIAPEYIDAFELTTDLLIETGRPEQAVEVLDKLKTINDASLYQNPMVKSSLLDEEELTQYQHLTNQLDALRKKQLMAASQELGLQSRIDQLTAQKRMLDRKITDLVDQKTVSLDEVQRHLGGREMVLHITELNNWYYLAQVSRNDVNFNKIRLDSTLRSQFNSAVENLSIGETDMTELSRISSLLGLNKLPNWVNTLTIIPDSYLYQLPLDILPLEHSGYAYSYGDATYVVEKFNTHYLTSLRDFIPDENNKKEYTWDFVGYGVSDFDSYTGKKSLVPLPHATSEVTNIVKTLSNIPQKTAYLNEASSEETFKETASKARILHLATHSELSQRDPLFSTIYMNPQQSSDNEDNFSGQIFAYELFELNLSNDLIMLNSCESGSGSYLQGSGVMGISRALRYAGASSLVLNLWSVNDMMASDFAIQFYKNIDKGQSKDEALRQAKLYFLKNKNANPHYWGPYMLIGERDPLVKPNRETNIYFAASFMLFFITIASFSLLKDWRGKAA